MITPIKYGHSHINLISELVNNRDVLDVGCVQHQAIKESSTRWLHKHIVKASNSLLGLDLAKDEVKQLQKRGYNVIYGDALTVDLNKKFNAIVAGEIIEHVDNPGIFLTNMRKHLTNDGIFIITTPNAFFVLHFLESVFCSPYKRWNPQHVQWYCYFTLENLLKRYGFEVVSCYFTTRSKKLLRIMKLTHLPCYSFLASTILIVSRLSDSHPDRDIAS